VDVEARLRAIAESTAAVRRARAESLLVAARLVQPETTQVAMVTHPETTATRIPVPKPETTKTIAPPPETTVVEIPPTRPELVQFVPPVYPESDRRAGRQGRVYVKVTVGPDGVVKDARVVKGIGGGCDDAALAAAKKCKFKPGTKNGQPADDVTTLPFTFQGE